MQITRLFPAIARRATPATLFITLLILVTRCAALPSETPQRAFEPGNDLLSLHYDHAPDKDDGQSAAADRTVLEHRYGVAWIRQHVVTVSGAYGENGKHFNPDSDAVMDAAWNDAGGWLAGHDERDSTVAALVKRWAATLQAGGHVWVKEGGQSDISAAVVQKLKELLPEVDMTARIHIVQHSDWNEDQTTDSALAYVRENTNYIRIRDANSYLNVKGGDEAFVEAATAHPVFGPVWEAAFAYYAPETRLDFSDTGELMYMLGLGEMGFDAFREQFLQAAP